MKAMRAALSIVLLTLLLESSPAHGRQNADEQSVLRDAFNVEYEAWKEHCQRVVFSSKSSDRLESQHFKNIVAMGPRALPCLAEKVVEDPGFHWSGWAWLSIARINPNPAVNPWAKEPIESWWQGGKHQANVRFEATYAKWKELRQQGKSEDASHARKTLRALGISVLPRLIANLNDDDGREILDIVERLTCDAADTSGDTVAQRVKSCLAWWDENKEDWLIPFPNEQPVARVGPDRSVAVGNAVQLDGSSSSDPDDDELRYVWTQISGPTVELLNAQTARPTFIAPRVEVSETVIFRLQVDDGSPRTAVCTLCQSGVSKPAEVRITVEPDR